MQIQVCPSILSANFGHLEREIRNSDEAGVDGFHLDIMDGHFVPNISFGPMVVETIRKYTKLPFNAHLMIDNPDIYIEDFAKAGADTITVHLESYSLSISDIKEIKRKPRAALSIDLEKAILDIRLIKSLGKKAGIAINPGTPVNLLDEIYPEVDEVLFMSVNPGFSGQAFMPEVLPRIRTASFKYKGDISVDGGVNDKNARSLAGAGANILITASYFYESKDYREAIRRLKNA